MSYCNECEDQDACATGCIKGAALRKQRLSGDALQKVAVAYRQLCEDVLRCIPADWKPGYARDYGKLGPILAEYIDDLRSETGWIACSERMPDESKPHEGYVLVSAEGAVDCLAFYKGQFVNWTNPESPNVYPEYITHWMQIPTPPLPDGNNSQSGGK